ncbi:exonuclease mut-7 homolog [Abrus precatorius]|uniref:Exonuclease mut-7 homolog n=1 Tax=Abrus precatorius TaxID=3816 RepID=A0A8B8K3G6_ABRPR|nr:exonuclease mut-7 homolog [Abrus precatorius]
MATIIDRDYRFNHVIYTVDLDGTNISVTVTATASVVRRWLSSTLYFRRHYVYFNQLVVGLGVQWTPGGADPPPDTLQLCIGRRCLIFQIAHADSVPKILRTLLQHPYHTFVGFWNHSDRRKLAISKHCLDMLKDPLDLRLYAETEDDEDLTRASVEEIAEKCLGFEVEQRREISTSYWYEQCLSDDQVVYAAVDAYCAFLLGRNIRAWEVNG